MKPIVTFAIAAVLAGCGAADETNNSHMEYCGGGQGGQVSICSRSLDQVAESEESDVVWICCGCVCETYLVDRNEVDKPSEVESPDLPGCN